jgi:hypothetical protein
VQRKPELHGPSSHSLSVGWSVGQVLVISLGAAARIRDRTDRHQRRLDLAMTAGYEASQARDNRRQDQRHSQQAALLENGGE